MNTWIKVFCLAVIVAISPMTAFAAVLIPFTLNLSEVVNVNTTGGTPRIAVDVGGVARYATYTAGTGTSALTFTYDAVIGDVDLDGVTLSSPIQLNGGSIKDTAGNDATLTFTPPNTTGVKVNYPSLGMDFVADADGRYTLNGTVYNDLPSFLPAAGGTFSRNSIATYYDSTGTLQTASVNTPRFDYDPVTLHPKGILIEESRTNFLIRSFEFDTWANFNITITTNAITAPDGTSNAELITRTSMSSNQIGRNVGKSAAAITYTASIFAKANSGRYLPIRLQGSYPGRADICFDLQTGTIATSPVVYNGFSAASGSIQNVGGGWYRLNFTATSDTNNVITMFVSPHADAVAIDLNDSSSTASVYVWGAQLEQGAFATSYIPTTTAAVTRAADVLSIPTGSWFNSTNGSFYAQSFGDRNRDNDLGYGRIVGTNAGKAFLSNGPDLSSIQTWSGTNPSLNYSFLPILSQSISGKFAMAWATSGTSRTLAANGGSVTGIYPGDYNATEIQIGSRGSGINSRNTCIKEVKYYPVDLSSTQLQLLTQ